MNYTGFTIETTDPVGAPPRAPYFWLNINTKSLFLAKGTDNVNDWQAIDLDLTHPTRTDNPHSVTAAQVGNTSAIWNASQLKGYSLGTGYSPANKSTLVYNASGPTIGWATTAIGQVAMQSYSATRKYGAAMFNSTLGELDPVYDLSGDNVYFNVKTAAKDVAQWNADRIHDTSVDDSSVNEGHTFYYTGGIYTTVNLKEQIDTTWQTFFGTTNEIITTTSNTSVQLVPPPSATHTMDDTHCKNDVGLFDYATDPENIICNFSGEVEYSIAATIQNTTTADGTARICITVDGTDQLDTECIATSTNTSNRYITVSRNGFLTVTQGQAIRLCFSNSSGSGNTIQVKASSASLKLRAFDYTVV